MRIAREWAPLIWRVMLAVASGFVIGLNRELRGKPAGLRTHILVSVGACLFVMVPLVLDGSTDGAARVVQGIAAGIGFLGAGEILRVPSTEPPKARVRGLTSAAAIWVAAALGAIAGCGLWRLSLIGSVVTWLSLGIVERAKRGVARLKKPPRSPQGKAHA